jgi:hypothetical protein
MMSKKIEANSAPPPNRLQWLQGLKKLTAGYRVLKQNFPIWPPSAQQQLNFGQFDGKLRALSTRDDKTSVRLPAPDRQEDRQQ